MTLEEEAPSRDRMSFDPYVTHRLHSGTRDELNAFRSGEGINSGQGLDISQFNQAPRTAIIPSRALNATSEMEVSAERDKDLQNISDAMTLLLAARHRVLTLAEQRVRASHLMHHLLEASSMNPPDPEACYTSTYFPTRDHFRRFTASDL